MQTERNYLVKFVFPQLRKLCESRGVVWSEVDLRWGITDEEKAEGKVLPLCLEEIHRCRPYFIGLLGERYGWIPDQIPTEVIERESWLREHVEKRKSVTELEILHGVLNSPEIATHAFFYFRDPKYINQVPNEERNDFLSENPGSATKLKALKARIREKGLSVQDYADPRRLGDLIVKDFRELIDNLYPPGEEPEPLDREGADHEAFAQGRKKVYIGRKEYFDRLDEHVQDDGPPLVVLGESGLGKSALLANWYFDYRERHPESFVLIHFIGNTVDSADPIRLLRRIMLELKRRFPEQLSDDVTNDLDKMREEFSSWLTRVFSTGKIVLILDGLNLLDNREGVPDLGWLPVTYPPNCRLIVSTLPGHGLNATRDRNWSEMTVQPLSLPEREELIGKFLAQYSRRLSVARVKRIASANQTANPLFLRAMLDELRQFGEHEFLGERIEHYLGAHDPGELYGRILQRWEQDYGERLVSDSLSLIWAARHGLSEAELLGLLGPGVPPWQPLPHASWTPFYLAAESSFSFRSGVLSFCHSYVRDAVAKRYLSRPSERNTVHGRIANYFESRPLFLGAGPDPDPAYSPLYGGDQITDWTDHMISRPYNQRKIIEEPWQRAAAAEVRRLGVILSDLLFFQAIWDLGHDEVASYWRAFQDSGAALMTEAFEGVIRNPDRFSMRLLWAVGRFLSENGFPEKAVPIQQCILQRTTGIRLGQIVAATNFAQTLSRLSDTDKAIGILKQVHEEMTKSGVAFALAPLACELGRLMYEQGRFREALSHLREASLLCRTGMEWESELLGKALVYRSLAHVGLGEMDAALRLSQQSVARLRRAQSESALAWSLTVRGSLLEAASKWQAAAGTPLGEGAGYYETLHDPDAADNVRFEFSNQHQVRCAPPMSDTYDQFKTIMEENTNGHEVEIRYGESMTEGLPAVRLFIYRDYPLPGHLSVVTYGLSLAYHKNWSEAKPELMICVNTIDDPNWIGVLGMLADTGRKEGLALEEGFSVLFNFPIGKSTRMKGLCVGGPAKLPLNPIVFSDRRIVIKSVYPIYSGETDIIAGDSLQGFAQRVGEDRLCDVKRPDLSGGT
jgi:tetratricopeptide (TPR) repeat protein